MNERKDKESIEKNNNRCSGCKGNTFNCLRSLSARKKAKVRKEG